METRWGKVAITPIATQESFSKKWFGSVKLSGMRGGLRCYALYDFGRPFVSREGATEFALRRGSELALEPI